MKLIMKRKTAAILKVLLPITLLGALMGLTLFLQSCGDGGDPPPGETEAQRVTNLLTSGQWSVQSVLVNATDQTTVYKDLKVTFGATNYTSTGGYPVWPALGTWKFKDETAKVIDRNDGVSITVTEITSNKLILGLTWNKTTVNGGRTGSVAGQHVFTLAK